MAVADQNITINSQYVGPWSRSQAEARVGRIDMLTGAFITDERQTWMDYVLPPMMYMPNVIFVKKDKAFPFNEWADLKGKIGDTLINNSFGQEFDLYAKRNLIIEEVRSIEFAFERLFYWGEPTTSSMNFIRESRLPKPWALVQTSFPWINLLVLKAFTSPYPKQANATLLSSRHFWMIRLPRWLTQASLNILSKNTQPSGKSKRHCHVRSNFQPILANRGCLVSGTSSPVTEYRKYCPGLSGRGCSSCLIYTLQQMNTEHFPVCQPHTAGLPST